MNGKVKIQGFSWVPISYLIEFSSQKKILSVLKKEFLCSIFTQFITWPILKLKQLGQLLLRIGRIVQDRSILPIPTDPASNPGPFRFYQQSEFACAHMHHRIALSYELNCEFDNLRRYDYCITPIIALNSVTAIATVTAFLHYAFNTINFSQLWINFFQELELKILVIYMLINKINPRVFHGIYEANDLSMMYILSYSLMFRLKHQ